MFILNYSFFALEDFLNLRWFLYSRLNLAILALDVWQLQWLLLHFLGDILDDLRSLVLNLELVHLVLSNWYQNHLWACWITLLKLHLGIALVLNESTLGLRLLNHVYLLSWWGYLYLLGLWRRGVHRVCVKYHLLTS